MTSARDDAPPGADGTSWSDSSTAFRDPVAGFTEYPRSAYPEDDLAFQEMSSAPTEGIPVAEPMPANWHAAGPTSFDPPDESESFNRGTAFDTEPAKSHRWFGRAKDSLPSFGMVPRDQQEWSEPKVLRQGWRGQVRKRRADRLEKMAAPTRHNDNRDETPAENFGEPTPSYAENGVSRQKLSPGMLGVIVAAILVITFGIVAIQLISSFFGMLNDIFG